MLSTIKTYLQRFNIFGSPLTANDEYALQNERISTRLFILLLTMFIVVILTYASQVTRVETIQIQKPSYNNFQSLSIYYWQTLHCQCENVAIPHESFIVLKPPLHQICSSDFLTPDWIDHISSTATEIVSDDFSFIGGFFFRALASFCRLANNTLRNALETFKSIRFTTARALDQKLFQEQVNIIIDNFQSGIELRYYRSFNFIQFSTEANTLMSSFFSNLDSNIDPQPGVLDNFPRLYANNTCNCDMTSLCFDPLVLQDRRANNENLSFSFTVPGLYTGCYLVNAIRHSTLECLYQSSCISLIEDLLHAPIQLNKSIVPLNSSVKSRFNLYSNIDQLLSKAMTEEWNKDISHVDYFRQCNPLSCTYTITTRFNFLYAVTVLIGLIGGLTKVLRLIIPGLVKLIRRRWVARSSSLALSSTSSMHISIG